MQQYKVINEQPVPEHLFFWKYSDYKARSQTPSRSKSPLRKQKQQQVKSTLQRLEEEEWAECTFKPQLFSKRCFQYNEGDFLQRCQQYEEQKQVKLQKLRMFDVENELKECTFQPKISQYVRNANTINLNETNKKQVLDNYLGQPKQSYAKQMYKYSDALNLLHKELHG
ncbi:unnamed protein product (macronuclear) [Paramecium tetraurelia]|uniref:Uncharacterized protein n=1 Tax=Paramecium tetraurelia TaxID=5888 RepID=A0C3K6_PARTE|nr:uncharacterized protein GSPATT00034852001 [Paramecium tetraurelia]CAK65373.1 unnamed protein product [Paramecium tetraurelia]|eukprot:XP_001432770.1 hypothetical protein (macronuclear) [Paramecium tetraurelia strain d4-2]